MTDAGYGPVLAGPIDTSKWDQAVFGPILYTVFEFEPKEFVSGNHTHKTAYGRGVRYKTVEAQRQEERIARDASVFARAANWVIPDYVYMQMVAYNLDLDFDNSKPMWDSLQGIIYRNDRLIKHPNIYMVRDKGPIRVHVAFQSIDGKAFGFPKPSKKRSPNV